MAISPGPDGGQSRQHVLSAISDGLVRLQKEYYGKGPEQARTHIAGGDAVFCILRGGFTVIERTLIDDGKADDVERMRRSFQDTMRHPFVGVVEDATGRKVAAYMSQVHADPDIAVEIFMLEPES
jgi:uncharacterized protein YbcI